MVYIIRMQGTNYFKVGYTGNDPEKRRRQLQTGNPRKLAVYATIEIEDESLERKFHQALFAYRTDGGDEWFEIEPNTLDQLIGEYYANARYAYPNSEIRGLYAHHVRQIRGGQQDGASPGSQDVLFARDKKAVSAQSKREFISERQEYDIGSETHRWAWLQKLGERIAGIRDD